MLVTHAQANKMLKKVDDELRHLMQIERKRSTYKEVEGIAPVVPEYSFIETRKRIQKLQNQRVQIKHAMNLFNATQKLEPLGMTVDCALIKMAQLTQAKSNYDNMRSEPAKVVNENSYNTKTEYTCLNYNPEDAEQAYQETCEALNEIQLALDYCNNTVQFNIP